MANLCQKDKIPYFLCTKDRYGRYPDYEGDFSNIIDIFSIVEVCNITNIDDKIKTYVDEGKNYFVYTEYLDNNNNTEFNLINPIQITNDNLVNDFLNKTASLESLIENEIYKTKL